MLMFINHTSRLENRMDNSIEKFVFHHQFLGGCLIFIGIPFVILAAVCACTAMIILPIAFLFGWI